MTPDHNAVSFTVRYGGLQWRGRLPRRYGRQARQGAARSQAVFGRDHAVRHRSCPGLPLRDGQQKHSNLRTHHPKKRWCPGEDSNLHGVTHWYLKPARLPIPPPGPGCASKGEPVGLSTGRSGRSRAAEAGGPSLLGLHGRTCRATASTRPTTSSTASSVSPAQSGRRTSRALRSSVTGKAPCWRAKRSPAGALCSGT